MQGKYISTCVPLVRVSVEWDKIPTTFREGRTIKTSAAHVFHWSRGRAQMNSTQAQTCFLRGFLLLIMCITIHQAKYI